MKRIPYCSKQLIAVLICCLLSISIIAQTCQFAGGAPAKFEPPEGRVYWFIGQNNTAINNYMSQVGSTPTPTGFTLYTNTRNWGLFSGFTNGQCETNDIQTHVNNPAYDNTALSIGYFWADAGLASYIGDIEGGNPNAAWVNDVQALANWCKAQDRPIFLRIGYEFDLQYLGFSSFYVAVWHEMVDQFRALNVDNVAFVWQAAYGNGCWDCGGSDDYIDFYPGDNYVDWFGYSQWDAIGGNTMINNARSRGKPLMIAESAPKQGGCNALNWTWYNNVINHIQANDDVIKAWAYINYDWVNCSGSGGCWNAAENWADSRIQNNTTVETNWLAEVAGNYWLKGDPTGSLLDSMNTNYGCDIPNVEARFSEQNKIDRVYVGETITFEDESFGSTTITSWSWNFGIDASPATAGTSGPPHDVSWSSPGLKTVSLTVSNGVDFDTYEYDVLVEAVPNGCVFTEEFDVVSEAIPFIDRNFGGLGPGLNAYWHNVGSNVWTISVDGHGSFDFFTYHFNDDTDAFSYNLSHPSAQPIITFRARKVPNTTDPVAGSTTAALLKVDIFDDKNIPTDGLPSDGLNNRFELTTTWQEFTVDFSDELINLYSLNGITGYGELDTRKLLGLQFMVNPFWNEAYAAAGFDAPYAGDIEIEFIHTGIGCDGAVTACILADKTTLEPGESVTFSNCSGGDVNTYSWDFGAGASPVTASTAGPHGVTYSSTGTKTISLTVSGPGGTDTYTTTVNVTACDAQYFDLFSSGDALPFTGGAGASGAFTYAIDSDVFTITSASGHGEWGYASLNINDGTSSTTVDVSSNPVMYIRAKASTDMVLRATLEDVNGIQAQNNTLQGNTVTYDPMAGSFNFPVTTTWQDYHIDFTGALTDGWSGGGGLDATQIAKIIFRPNPGWVCCDIFGSYDDFVGDLDIEYIVLAGDTNTCLGNSLPVTLLAFNGEFSNGTVNLSWTTATEVNNDYFTIERSADGESWESIHIVEGRGNSSEIMVYEITDQNPFSGTSYYRLKQTDYDGAYSYSGIVAVNSKKEVEISTYPNPFSELVTIKTTGLSGTTKVTICDLTGKSLFSCMSEGDLFKTFDPDIAPGHYLVKVRCNGRLYTSGLIKY